MKWQIICLNIIQGVSQIYYDKNENVSEQIDLTCTNEKK